MDQLILATIQVVNVVLTLLIYAIIVRAALSWFRPDPNNFFVKLIIRVTDPVLSPFSRFIPSFAGLDITPVIAILIIHLIQKYVLGSIVVSLIH